MTDIEEERGSTEWISMNWRDSAISKQNPEMLIVRHFRVLFLGRGQSEDLLLLIFFPYAAGARDDPKANVLIPVIREK